VPTITAELMARHDEKTSAGRAKMLSRDWQKSMRYWRCALDYDYCKGSWNCHGTTID